jgi:hypothetical protein
MRVTSRLPVSRGTGCLNGRQAAGSTSPIEASRGKVPEHDTETLPPGSLTSETRWG